jgi:pyruvate dehydrogenase (quinone)
MRYPMDAHLTGDAKETLRALLPLLRRKEDRDWRQRIEKAVREWHELCDRRAGQEFGDGINPQAVVAALSPLLPDDTILSADSGSSTNWWARHLMLRPGMAASLSGTLATMGPAMPYAIAARFAHPQRPVIAFIGDGAFQMNGMNELITIRRYLDRLSAPAPFVLCVFNNQDLNQVTWEQRAMSGDPKLDASQEIPDVPYAAFAELLGFRGIRCTERKRVKESWEAALSADRPVLLEFLVDPDVPPIPPHITTEQAKQTAKAMVRDPDRSSIATRGVRQKLAEFTHHLPGRH